MEVKFRILENCGKGEKNKEGKDMTKKRTHCESCGEWLEGFDTSSECGRINI